MPQLYALLNDELKFYQVWKWQCYRQWYRNRTKSKKKHFSKWIGKRWKKLERMRLNFEKHRATQLVSRRRSQTDWFVNQDIMNSEQRKYQSQKKDIMSSHLALLSCLYLCILHQLCLCYHITSSAIHLCCVPRSESISSISSTIVYHNHFLYLSSFPFVFTIFGHTHVTLTINPTFTID